MTSTIIPLADGFSGVTRSAWLALVTKTLKGAGAESLIGKTPDDLPVLPLYTQEDCPAVAGFVHPEHDAARGWDVRSTIGETSPAAANAAAREALSGGAASLLVKIDNGDAHGVRVTSSDDLAAVLDGVLVEVAPIALDAGILGPVAARWLGHVAKAAPSAPLALHMDPFSAFARAGATPGPLEAHVSAASAAYVGLSQTYPKASGFLASGAVVHEAGGSPAWELAFATAAAVAYAKGLVAAGLDMETSFGAIALGVVVDAEPLAGIAKLRAARVLWDRVTSACGIAGAARIECRSSERMLTRADRWSNLVRLTSAGFAAAVGGADAIVLGTFTDAIGAPDAFALRMARNTQLILMEEAHLGRVADPAAGSWAVEAQTMALAEAAWASFVAIEAAGGLAAALQSGLVADAVEASMASLASALADRRLRIIGVTDFAGEDATPDATFAETPALDLPIDVRQPGLDSACRRLSPVRLEDLAQ